MVCTFFLAVSLLSPPLALSFFQAWFSPALISLTPTPHSPSPPPPPQVLPGVEFPSNYALPQLKGLYWQKYSFLAAVLKGHEFV